MLTKMKIHEMKEEEEEDREQKAAEPAGGSTSTSTTLTAPDRISELPTNILLHILGLLEMDKSLIGTSLVSKQWRNLWKYVPTLTFTLQPSGSGIVDNEICGSLDNDGFVVLRLRDSEASKIQIFNLSWEHYWLRDHAYLERLHNFIVTVVNQGAQEIDIMGGRYSNRNEYLIHFNPSIFTSKLLRKFRFKISNNPHLFQFPRSMCCATQLTQLVLNGIKLPEGDNSAQLHLVCPVLETLVLGNCYSKHLKVLDISAPRLNELVIFNIEFFSDFLGGCRIEIRTPNLTSLIYAGCAYVDCFTENLPCIDSAGLYFCTLEETEVEKDTSFVIKLLKGLTNAKTLKLWGFEVFSQDTLRDLLTPFTSVRTLEVISSCNISSIHGMVHFLNSCNSINKLVWKVDEDEEVEGDEHLMLPQCSLSHLKHVHIEGLEGHENEIEFVKFLLKSSIVLEDIIIVTIDSSNISIEENLKQFIEEEPSFRTINLLKKNHRLGLSNYMSKALRTLTRNLRTLIDEGVQHILGY